LVKRHALFGAIVANGDHDHSIWSRLRLSQGGVLRKFILEMEKSFLHRSHQERQDYPAYGSDILSGHDPKPI
jgi:hypothetical protein